MSANVPNKPRKRRHSKACTRCRKKKIRCDFQYPTCGACLAANAACLGYDSIHGTEKPRSTITHLEQEVARLETELERIKSQSTSISDVATAEIEGLTNRMAASILDPERRPARPETLVPLASRLFLTPSTVPYLCSQAWDGSKTPTPPGSPRSAIYVSSIPRPVVDTMLKHYCQIYRPQYPAMEESDLYEACHRVYSNAAPSHFDAFCVHITLAISTNTLRYQDAKRAEEATSGFWATALVHLEHVGLESSWERLQALQLLAHYGFLNPGEVDCASCAAAATRLCMQLGLHQELPELQQMGMDKATLNARRRLFWHSYSIDSAVHSTRCRPFLWPTNPPGTTLPEFGVQLSPTTHVWSLRQLESEITLAWYYAPPSLEDPLPGLSREEMLAIYEGRLERWYQAIREDLTLREKLEFHELHYQMLVLRLNRPSLRFPDPTAKMSKKAVNACVGVIRELSVVDQLGKLFYLWHFDHCIVEAAICLLGLVLAAMVNPGPGTAQLEREDANTLARYLKAAPILLKKIARRWSNAALHATVLDSISTQVLDKLQQWSNGDTLDSHACREIKSELRRISLFSPFPREETPVASDAAEPVNAEMPLASEAAATAGTALLDASWAAFPAPMDQGSSEFPDPFDIENGDALAWDFSGMDPEEIFVSLLERGQAPPLLDPLFEQAPFLPADAGTVDAVPYFQ